MDYAYYAAQAPQPYQFNAFPPTPTHSYETQDERMLDTTQVASGLPEGTAAEDVYPGFAPYDPSYQFSTNNFLPAQQLTDSPPNSNHRHSMVSLPGEQANGTYGDTTTVGSYGDASKGSFPPLFNGESDNHDLRMPSPDQSDEKDNMTPQQTRRKAQNRAAQRAFRERKERHVKELETRLSTLSAHSSQLLSQNERLKRDLQKLATQNEILRATSQPAVPRSPSPIHGPLTYSPTDFVTAVDVNTNGHPISYASYNSADGKRLLAGGAAWDLIQGHELFRRGMVDITEVVRRLKGKAACDGRGPAFKEIEVIRAIEESAQSGSDELI